LNAAWVTPSSFKTLDAEQVQKLYPPCALRLRPFADLYMQATDIRLMKRQGR
jgi:hypothetical protein